MAENRLAEFDKAAEEARQELKQLLAQNVDGVMAVARWAAKWYLKAGYRRLGRILASLGKES